MVDDHKKPMDPHADPDKGQMGGQTPSGKKGGQAQSDLKREDYSRGDTSRMGEDTRSLADEDL